MDVAVGDGLSGGGAVVDADGEAVGMKFLLQNVPDLVDRPPQGVAVDIVEVEDGDGNLFGHDQGMAGRHREGVMEGDGFRVLVDDAGRIKGMESGLFGERHGG